MIAESLNVDSSQSSMDPGVNHHAHSEDIPRTDILGVKISALNMSLTVETIEHWVGVRQPNYMCISTVHGVMECQDDPKLRMIYNNAGIVTPDGMPLVWLSRNAGNSHVSRVYGPDLMLELCERSMFTGHSHFFYGGMPGVAEELADTLAARFPGLNVAGTYSPAMQRKGDIESSEVIQAINDSEADIVWCGLGTPKQDYWIANHRPLLNAPVLIAVGAAFDFHTGRVKQAPGWMQERGLEWFFRLMQDPKRLWKRYLVGNSRFVLSILRSRYLGR